MANPAAAHIAAPTADATQGAPTTVAARIAASMNSLRERAENKDYKSQWKQFIEFVDSTEGLIGTPCYLTRENIDFFFAQCRQV